MKRNTIVIVPNPEPGGSKTGSLVGITVEQINKVLGFKPNCEDDPSKVKYSWGFKVGDKTFGVWDYKGSAASGYFSTDGDHTVLRAIFGDKFSSR